MGGKHGCGGVGRQRGGMPLLVVVASVVRDGGARADDAITLGGLPLIGPGCKCVVPERVGCQTSRNIIEDYPYCQRNGSVSGDNSDSDLRWTTSDSGGRGVLNTGVDLFEGLRAGKGPDTKDYFAVEPQPLLVPPHGGGFGHAAQVGINADTVARVPADDGDVISPLPEGRGAAIWKHTVGGDERNPRSCSP